MPFSTRRSWILGAGLLYYLAAIGWLFATHQTDLRPSGDHTTTIPLWRQWLPILAGMALVWMLPPRSTPSEPQTEHPRLSLEAWVLLALGLAFPVMLAIFGTGDTAFIVLKLLLLVAVPLLLFRANPSVQQFLKRLHQEQREHLGKWHWWSAILAFSLWFALTYLTPWATHSAPHANDALTLAAVVFVGFLVNAVIEEVFYRVWLQSRLEIIWGRWPAILVASLIWASWHVLIQGGKGFGSDLASAIANQGVIGLFLGLLWAKYRNIWSLLLIHGAVNAVPLLLPLLAK